MLLPLLTRCAASSAFSLRFCCARLLPALCLHVASCLTLLLPEGNVLLVEYLLRYERTRDASAASFRLTRARSIYSALLSPASHTPFQAAADALSSFLRDRRGLFDGTSGGARGGRSLRLSVTCQRSASVSVLVGSPVSSTSCHVV